MKKVIPVSDILRKSKSLRVGPNPDARPPIENPIQPNMESFMGLALGWLQENRKRWSPETERHYSTETRRFALWVGDRTITRAVVQEYYGTLNSYQHCHRAKLIVRNVLQRAVDLGLTDHNPAEGVPNPHAIPGFKTETFTRMEYKKMKEATKGTTLYAPIVIAWNTGLRISDVIGLQWEDIDFENQMIQRMPIKTRRMGTMMSQPILSGSDLFEVLLALRDSTDVHQGFVFPQWNEPGRSRLSDCVHTQFAALLRRLGIRGKSFHTFRRTWLTNLASSGCDTIMAMHMAGITNVQTLKHYIVPGAAAMRAALEQAAEFGEMHG